MRKSEKKFQIKRLFGATVEARRDSMGYAFILPWLAGVALFFVFPMIQASLFLFSEVELVPGGLERTFAGTDIFNKVFLVDAENIRIITQSLQSTFVNALLILAFSLIIAILINKPFKGRGACRALLALPILVSSGVLMQAFNEDMFKFSMEQSSQVSAMLNSALFETLLNKIGLPWEQVWALSGIIDQVLNLIWQSGIQILLFTAGMQTIPKSYMEVCETEGATPWQSFWRVTFPLLSPFIILNFVYAAIDNFTYYTNPVVQKISQYFNKVQYSYGTALSFVYFLVVLIVVGVSMALISKKVFYIEE